MAISEVYTGSQTVGNIDAQQLMSAYPNTTDGVYQIVIDTTGFAVGQVIELKVNNYNINTGRHVYKAYPAWGCKIWASPALNLNDAWYAEFTNKVGSTSSLIKYSIRKVA